MKTIEKYQKIYDTLKQISKFQTLKQLQRNSERQYGLEYEEVIEMAYENIIDGAKLALKGMRRPK